MSELVVVTYDWVPEKPRGHVRDIRIRWALEEAGLPYRVESTPFKNRGDAHYAHQPFGQAPWLIDGDRSIFESGAVLLHLGEKSEKLMPKDAKGRSETIEWVFAALNSVEAASQHWSLFHFFDGAVGDNAAWKFTDSFLMKSRLPQLEKYLTAREWLTGQFSIADILMADVLRMVDRFEGLATFPACKAYVARATARPAFKKALADQMAHFAKADI